MTVIPFALVIVAVIVAFLLAANGTDAGIVVHAYIFAAAAVATAFALIWRNGEARVAVPAETAAGTGSRVGSGSGEVVYNDLVVRYGLIASALAGLAGCALSLIGTVDPEVGKTYIVDSFMVVVLGGVGKLFGTILASFGVGMSNKILEPLIPGTAAAVYAKVAILVLVIFFLQLKPTGLFPAKERTAASAVR
jgi:hypothetical protein